MRGESILYKSHPIKKKKEIKKSFPLPRIDDLAETSEDLGLLEWIESDDWVGGHFWIARGENLPAPWKEEGSQIARPHDFLALIARSRAHIAALGKADTVHFSPDFGGDERAQPMRDVLKDDNERILYVNSNYLEAALRIAGEPERWHIANLNGRNMLIGYSGEDPQIIIAPAR